MFTNNWKKEEKEQERNNAIVRIIIRQLREDFNNNQLAIRETDEFKNFETTFKAEDPTVTLFLGLIKEQERILSNLHKIKSEATDELIKSSVNSSINCCESNISKLTCNMVRFIEEAKEIKFPELNRSFDFYGVESLIKDLIKVNGDKTASKLIEVVVAEAKKYKHDGTEATTSHANYWGVRRQFSGDVYL